MQSFAVLLVVAAAISFVAAECPNACSAHGRCGAYDMCTCYRNWMANDCSERVCQFGLAHVDTPKGDLDASGGALSGPETTVIKNDAVYPYGTVEQYPNMIDLSGTVLTNTAHEYRECSNKGICDRSTGTCSCFEGYDGSACQRASCPTNDDGLVCSGHGVCEDIKTLTGRDFDNEYLLWDETSTMGCRCDGGYSGPDCSQKICKVGVDPLYSSQSAALKEYPSANPRYSNYTYQFYTTAASVTLTGNYSLIFYDSYGEDWETEPISYNASCAEVRAALVGLPNQAVPTVRCYKSPTTTDGVTNGQESGVDPIYDTNMYVHSKYTIAFPDNPGKLSQIAINIYLDGTRPTLFTDETTSTLGYHIYPNGFISEDVDMVPDLCDGVMVTLGSGTTSDYLSGLDTATTKLLKRCLGDSDGYAGDNVEVYNWDYGNVTYPHLIKLVDATQDFSLYQSTVGVNGDYKEDTISNIFPKTQLCDTTMGDPMAFGQDAFGVGYCSNVNPPGFYAVLIYDASYTTYPFRLYTRAANDYSTTTQFYLFTTTGYLQQVSPNAGIFTTTPAYTAAQAAASHYSNVVMLTNTTSRFPGYYGNVDCLTNAYGENGAIACLNKNDHVMFLAANETMTATLFNANPVYPNIYQVKKLERLRKTFLTDPSNPNSEKIRNRITLDYSMNVEYSYRGGVTNAADTTASMYKFWPPTNTPYGGYKYVDQCATRGICNTETGECDCFPGYTGDNCAAINALAS